MAGLVDIHSHILPEVDDGATSMEMALEMLRRGLAEG
jgi:protein-tyrosine phosphatase